MNIIEELYYGNIQPHIWKHYDTELVALVDRHESWLKEHLDSKALETVGKLVDCYGELNANTACDSFRDGFILGARLVMAVCCGDHTGDDTNR